MSDFIPYIIIFALLIVVLIQNNKIKDLNDVLDNSKTKDVDLEIEEEEIFDEKEIVDENILNDPRPIDRDFTHISKTDAIAIINKDQNKYSLTTRNTRFSNINTTVPVWWFDIPIELFKNDLHLILKKKSSFYWLCIPRGTFEFPQNSFYIRPDNGKVQLQISTESGLYFMRDKAPGCKGVGFEKYIIKEFK
ncbi:MULTISPECIES: hypothetical protein [Flavobacteriaceae]|nr:MULTISPECIES: hypothetical protein [Flavobacteriaceae]HAB26941.1 hypothetical protein [Xanthomarina gelatinilytica]MAL22066.1 hypothetical protein [Xanthomarina sp.]MBF62072.1 hypothetical protein [Xanthomarina sp.]MDX1279194.1 hypothetical protein [Oceanihabitans sediminis]HAI20249.1 hypothetical protein [Xanthomarina gelatinilytica]|tara:strand:- start:118 stop:693 length:576 start_codon:yes stop_codon:yes gene_type:complete